MLRRVTDHCFLKMPINAVRYRVTVEIFNNRKLIINLRFELPSCSKLSNNLSNYECPFRYCFTFFSLHFCFQGVMFQKLAEKIFLLFNILLGLLVWLCSCLIILRGNVEGNAGPKNSVSECLSIVTGTSTAYRPMTVPNYFF